MEGKIIFESANPDDRDERKRQLVETLTNRVRQQVSVDAAQSRQQLLAYAKEQDSLDDIERAILVDALLDLDEEVDYLESAFRDSMEQKLGIQREQIAAPDVIVVDIHADNHPPKVIPQEEWPEKKEKIVWTMMHSAVCLSWRLLQRLSSPSTDCIESSGGPSKIPKNSSE